MKKTLVLVICCILTLGFLCKIPVNAESVTDKIDKFIQDEMETGKIPGLSLGIVHGNDIIYLKGYGEARSDGSPVTAQTPFVLGSVSKVFTALAVRQLVNESKMDYDAPVTKYIPWFTTADSEESASITIQNLLNHTSGFSTKSGGGIYTGYKYSLDELVHQLDKVKLDRPVGVSAEYSNINYLVLGLAVQMVSGIEYSDYIQKNIFEALDMKNSFTSEAEAVKNGLATGYRNVYGINLPIHIPYPAGNMSHGFLMSSAEDMSKLMVCYLNNGYYLGKSIIPDNELRMRDETITPYTGNEPYYSNYWDIRQGDKGYYGHSGATVNYTSTFLVSQQSRYGIVILSNSSNDFYTPAITPDSIIKGVISILEGNSPLKTENVQISQNGYGLIVLSLILFMLIIIRIYWIRFFLSGISTGKIRRTLKLVSLVLIDFILPVGVIISINTIYDTTVLYAFSAIPEQAIPILIPIFILLIIGIIKVFLLIKMVRRTKIHKF